MYKVTMHLIIQAVGTAARMNPIAIPNTLA